MRSGWWCWAALLATTATKPPLSEEVSDENIRPNITAPRHETTPSTPPPTLIERVMAIRLHDDTPWLPNDPVGFNLQKALVPPDHEWPHGPAADALWTALAEGGDGMAFVEAARAEGLLDHAPSDYDDADDRVLAIFAAYITAQGEIDEELLRVWSRTPEGPWADPLSMAVFLVIDEPETRYAAASDLLFAAEASTRAVARAWLAEQEDTTLDELTRGDADDPAALSVLLGWAMTHQHSQAGALAAALAHHPDASPSQRTDGEAALALLVPPPTEAWAGPLANEVRACAGVLPGERVAVVVSQGIWRFEGDGPAAACLQGWSWPADDLRLQLRITR